MYKQPFMVKNHTQVPKQFISGWVFKCSHLAHHYSWRISNESNYDLYLGQIQLILSSNSWGEVRGPSNLIIATNIMDKMEFLGWNG